MRTVICPIDNLACDGANGTTESDKCIQRCTRGKDFADKAVKYARPTAAPVDEPASGNHGGLTFSRKSKCPCELCAKRREEYLEDQRIFKRGRRQGEPDRVKTFTHGTRYAWEVKKCQCEPCLEHRLEHYRKYKEKQKTNPRPSRAKKKVT
jgi:hypothetical protein